jgi:EpsI family protein
MSKSRALTGFRPWLEAFTFPTTAMLIFTLMAVAALGCIALTPTRLLSDSAPKIDIAASIPKSFGDWQVDENVIPVNPSPTQRATLELIYDQTVSRTYVNSKGQRIMLSVAYGASQTREMRAHRQEVCYAAQGFQINDLKHELISIGEISIPATRMVAVQQYRTEPVTYWFTMGNEIVRSYLDRQLAQIKYAISGLIPDGYLFRVSSIESNPEIAYRQQIEFAGQLLQASTPELRRKLLGEAEPQ